jgi:hypothetical protein
MDEQAGKLDPDAAAWLRGIADRDFGGDFGRAAAAIIEAEYAAATAPDDPWRKVQTLARLRSGGRK